GIVGRADVRRDARILNTRRPLRIGGQETIAVVDAGRYVAGLEQRVLFDVWQDVQESPAVRVAARLHIARVNANGRWQESAVGVGTVDRTEADLPQVVAALCASGGLAHLLDRRQEQADQDGDDRDHHQQLDQREPPRPAEYPHASDRHGTTLRRGNACSRPRITLTNEWPRVCICTSISTRGYGQEKK